MKIGAAADAKQDYISAIAAYRKIIEMDPENTRAQRHFVESSMSQANVRTVKLFQNPDYAKFERGQLHGHAKKAIEAESKRAGADATAARNALLATYDQWIATQPKVAAFYWAKGYALSMMDKTTGVEELFQKAISLDPKFVPAYNSMADVEFEKGDYAKQRDYLKRVMDLDPSNPNALRSYAETFQFSDPAKFRQLATQYAEKFPKGSDCTYLLWQLENTEPSAAERFSVLESMRESYLDRPVSTEGMDEPDVFTNWLEEAMADLFNLYAQDKPQQALALAQEMQKQKWADPGWKDAVAYQQNLINALDLMANRKDSDASALLQKQFTGFIVKYYVDHTPVTLALAEAQAESGNVRQAFDILATAWIKAPNSRLKAALLKYGAKLGQTPDQADVSMWQKWTSTAKQMKPFELRPLDGRKKIKLSDFRGRVVLVSFWFPLCGPCRDELPYFDEVARKYQSQGFAILAINGVPAQDSYAPGVLKNYDIIGFKVPSDKWAKQYDNVSGYPTNYLLNAKGQIMAHPRVDDAASLTAFETQIAFLLAHAETSDVVAKTN